MGVHFTKIDWDEFQTNEWLIAQPGGEVGGLIPGSSHTDFLGMPPGDLRKMFLSKKSLNKGLFGRTPIWGNLTLEAKPVTSGQFLGYPWKLWDITPHSSYVGGRRHQKLLHSRAFFCGRTWKNAKYASIRKMLRNWFFLGRVPSESLRAQLSEYAYERGVQFFLPRFCRPKSKIQSKKYEV